jgi:flagellar basal-body rod protein FlgG
MWTAVSGASAQAQQVDVVANNLANADTLGFKKDVTAFQEYLSTLERESEPRDIPQGPIRDKHFYPMDGKDQSFVVVRGTHANFRQGHLRVTNSPLDVALDGPGFLEVNTPAGIRYTRQGSLKIAPDGNLVTSEGHPVLASRPSGLAEDQAQGPGAPVESRFINLRDRNQPLSISAQGELYSGEERIATLSVREFQDLQKVQKRGLSLFESVDPANLAPVPSRTVVRQGMLETSNVNPIEEMTNLIKANRLFEHDLKVMKTYGDLLQREANDIGKL